MKILKVYIQNFKGIKEKKIIDLGKDITFLTGPNGFGKTTIFDAIEICLTGELYRITDKDIETSKIADGRIPPGKPFYQHDITKPVLLKILIELDNGSRKILIAYDDNKDKSRNRPATLYFRRFIEDYNEVDNTFYDKENGLNNKDLLDNGRIGDLLGLTKDGNIASIYKIFNYLQQEETTFFLKKSAHTRHGNLNFLFKTKDEYDKQRKIENFRSKINDISTKLNERVSEIKKELDEKKGIIGEKEAVSYTEFFDSEDKINSKNIDFDRKELFNIKLKDENIGYKEKYLSDLKNIKDFLADFDIIEYSKKIRKDSLISIRSNDDFLEYFLLQGFDSKDEYLRLENDNHIYNLSNKIGYLEHIIYEKFLANEEFDKLKEYAFLHTLNDKDSNNLLYFILQDIVNNEKYIKELEAKDNLINFLNQENGLLDSFLLEKLTESKSDLKNDYYIYNAVNSNDNTLVKCFIFHQFFNKSESISRSKYDELEAFYHRYKSLKNFKQSKQDEKIKGFTQILGILGGDNSKLLNEFDTNIKRKKELKDDLSSNDRIISELNDLRNDLVSFYEGNISGKVSIFDDACLLCGTTQVINGVTNKKIENFNAFKLFVEEKTSNINKVSQNKTKSLDEINEKINENIKALEHQLDVIIDSNESLDQVSLFENISKYLSKDNYEKYGFLLDVLLKDNPNISVGKVVFERLENDILALKNQFLKKYELSYLAYNKLNGIKLGTQQLIDKSILRSFLVEKNIEFHISKEDIGNGNYQKKKSIILNEIQTYIKGFNQGLYTILNTITDSEFVHLYKQNTIRLNSFLGDKRQEFLVKDIDSINDIGFHVGGLNKYIKENTLEHHIFYNRITPLKENTFIKNEELRLLKESMKQYNLSYPRLESIIDYDEEYHQKSLGMVKENISIFFNKRISIFKSLQKLRGNKEYSKFHDYSKSTKEDGIEGLEDCIITNYNDYSNFISIKAKMSSILYNFIEGIKIDNKKLGGDVFYILQDVFGQDIGLVEKYQLKKNELNGKHKYIEYKYFELENRFLTELNGKHEILKNRLMRLKGDENKLINKLDKLIDTYSVDIKSHKEKMANGIKIPFFIYTAKILQNFQQGMGIYIAVNFENKEGIDYKKETIVFYSDGKSKNDVMHQLSSGQLSVVALAFTLSINKAYRLSKELNFLNIDDPIQELDALNIHSFIELIRHNFLDYNFIMSTHSDENAYFMKYKIEKIKGKNSTGVINVQNEFFNTVHQKLNNPTNTI